MEKMIDLEKLNDLELKELEVRLRLMLRYLEKHRLLILEIQALEAILRHSNLSSSQLQEVESKIKILESRVLYLSSQ